MSNQFTFYFHDYETFGISPAYDRPAQFAGIRTDSDLNIIEEPLVVYCKPANDYLPNPDAVLITGITPQLALKKGLVEAEFTKQIHDAFSESNTCIIGYNNIRFDDEVTRNILYRNFYDPYAYSWQNGNSRWDLLDVVRACYALRPEGIEWPLNDDGLPSFRLEYLTKANNITHEQAHDAMSDVYATIAMAKLIKTKQPRLFDYLFSLRNKNKVAELIDVLNMTPLVHVSGMLGAYRGNTSWVSPIVWHPLQNNAVVVCDLMGDVQTLLDLSTQQLKERLYTKNEDLALGESRIPLKLVHTNKCPILTPAKTLLPENADRLGIDRDACLQNLQLLKDNQAYIQDKITELFSQPEEYPTKTDVDGQLYDGFFDNQAKSVCQTIRTTNPEQLSSLNLSFTDQRLKALFFRYKARNYPQSLNDLEQKQWQAYRADKLNQQYVHDYILELENKLEANIGKDDKVALLKDLYNYCHYLVG
ncbi:exodeoxyribonuclease I [Zophobihabitans entericus]|uniref:Exodeoxyribonuclease I n=1 Tax=Zophobihabitans entericus TaxID=1635327 RepID=A0A6G9IE68_9GAMM|nr:exodeoxyribonuclease I [Zophobihabitans entericus]QIQ22112.1 exodeoxyribonuclease I [Zophobihabitans entericus]